LYFSVKNITTIGQLSDHNSTLNKNAIAERKHMREEANPEPEKPWYHNQANSASSKEISKMTNKQKRKYILEGDK